jgi:hypothetical protein
MSKRVTQSEYARHIGLSRQYVSKFIKQHNVELDGDKKFDLALADELRKNVADPSRQLSDDSNSNSLPDGGEVNSSPPSGPSFNQAKTVGAVYDSKMKEMEYKKMAGSLVELVEVKRAAFDCGQIVKEKFLSTIPNMKGEIVSIKDENDAVQFLRKNFKAILEDINQDVGRRLQELS